MKICYVVTKAGTIISFFLPQLKYIASKGIDVTVVCSDDERIRDALGSNIRFRAVKMPRGISFGNSLRAVHELTRVFREECFDLIQYSTPNAALYASIAAMRAGCNIRNYHLMGLRYLGSNGIERKVLKQLEKEICRKSTSIECVSKSNMELGIREGLFKADKAKVIWNGSSGGVDLDRFNYQKRQQWRTEIRRKLGYADKDFIYGFVGRITRDKGVNELLEAYLKLKTDAKLILIGQIEDKKSLDSNLIEEIKSNPNVQVHNSVPDIERYYAAIDVLVLPSYREGFGNVVIEAAAMGTPAIVSDIPGPTDAIARGHTALVVSPKNAKDLTEAMEQIRDLNPARMGEEAEQFVKNKFDSKVLCEKIYERKLDLFLKQNGITPNSADAMKGKK
ncbi:MAG: glycosyltransferase family 4 protein [Eubacteriales bacterium]|nr:glycosyltransferase family 4 protein [Eubacteriales bacterium]